MSDDIVKRLREEPWVAATHYEAAEEIERLRAELAAVTKERGEIRMFNAMIYGTSHPEIYKTPEDERIEQLEAELALANEVIDRLVKTEHEVGQAIGDRYLLDPPDGGDVKLWEGVQRIKAELAAERENFHDGVLCHSAETLKLTAELAAANEVINSLVKTEDEVTKAIGGQYLLDPPDGGDVSLAEGVERIKAELAAERERVEKLSQENAVLRCDAAGERERVFKKDKRIDELMGKCVDYAVTQAKLRAALEDAAICLDGWDIEMASRAHAVLADTQGEREP
jgi:hypothetical protein